MLFKTQGLKINYHYQVKNFHKINSLSLQQIKMLYGI